MREFGLALRNQKDRRSPVALKTEMLKEIYSMLVRAYGVPPTEFEWTLRDKEGNVVKTETYTPSRSTPSISVTSTLRMTL